MLGYIDDGSLDAFKWFQSTGRIRLSQCLPQAASCLIILHHGLTVSAQDKSIFSIIKYQNLNNSIELFNSFEGRGWLYPKQGHSECNSVYEHLANFIKKIIIKLSQKKARPPLGEALPSISAAAWGSG